jgi:hypothetical protein
MGSNPMRAAKFQFTIAQTMIVLAVFVVLFAVVPTGLAVLVMAALFIPLVTDLAGQLRPRAIIQPPAPAPDPARPEAPPG